MESDISCPIPYPIWKYLLSNLAIILVPPVDASWVNIIAVPIANNALPKIVASTKLFVNANDIPDFSVIESIAERPKAA